MKDNPNATVYYDLDLDAIEARLRQMPIDEALGEEQALALVAEVRRLQGEREASKVDVVHLRESLREVGRVVALALAALEGGR